MMPVRLEHEAPRSRVKHSTTELPISILKKHAIFYFDQEIFITVTIIFDLKTCTDMSDLTAEL